jgi:hypothetical protein
MRLDIFGRPQIEGCDAIVGVLYQMKESALKERDTCKYEYSIVWIVYRPRVVHIQICMLYGCSSKKCS